MPSANQHPMTDEDLIIELRRPRWLGGLPDHLEERYKELRDQRTAEWLGNVDKALRAKNF